MSSQRDINKVLDGAYERNFLDLKRERQREKSRLHWQVPFDFTFSSFSAFSMMPRYIGTILRHGAKSHILRIAKIETQKPISEFLIR